MDPARDTPAALQKVVEQAQAGPRPAGRWRRRRRTTCARWPAVLGIRYRQLADGEFNHSSMLILVDANGRILARTEKIGTQPDPEFVAAVRKAVGG